MGFQGLGFTVSDGTIVTYNSSSRETDFCYLRTDFNLSSPEVPELDFANLEIDLFLKFNISNSILESTIHASPRFEPTIKQI